MLGHQERIAILLLICVAGVVIGANLVLGIIGKHPFASDFSNQSADGDLVTVHGLIDEVTVTKNGGHYLLKIDNVSVFIPSQAAGTVLYAKGKTITLYGTVQTYRGEKEIIVNSAEDISMLP